MLPMSLSLIYAQLSTLAWAACGANRVYNFVSLNKQGVYFVNCPKHGPKMKGVVLIRVDILGLFLS